MDTPTAERQDALRIIRFAQPERVLVGIGGIRMRHGRQESAPDGPKTSAAPPAQEQTAQCEQRE